MKIFSIDKLVALVTNRFRNNNNNSNNTINNTDDSKRDSVLLLSNLLIGLFGIGHLFSFVLYNSGNHDDTGIVIELEHSDRTLLMDHTPIKHLSSMVTFHIFVGYGALALFLVNVGGMFGLVRPGNWLHKKIGWIATIIMLCAIGSGYIMMIPRMICDTITTLAKTCRANAMLKPVSFNTWFWGLEYLTYLLNAFVVFPSREGNSASSASAAASASSLPPSWKQWKTFILSTAYMSVIHNICLQVYFFHYLAVTAANGGGNDIHHGDDKARTTSILFAAAVAIPYNLVNLLFDVLNILSLSSPQNESTFSPKSHHGRNMTYLAVMGIAFGATVPVIEMGYDVLVRRLLIQYTPVTILSIVYLYRYGMNPFLLKGMNIPTPKNQQQPQLTSTASITTSTIATTTLSLSKED